MLIMPNNLNIAKISEFLISVSLRLESPHQIKGLRFAYNEYGGYYAVLGEFLQGTVQNAIRKKPKKSK